jgi:hypothetical protein
MRVHGRIAIQSSFKAMKLWSRWRADKQAAINNLRSEFDAAPGRYQSSEVASGIRTRIAPIDLGMSTGIRIFTLLETETLPYGYAFSSTPAREPNKNKNLGNKSEAA